MECDSEKLLVCVENRPAIYNFNLKEHSNRSVVEKLWEEVAGEMNLTVAEYKAKWVSLRNSYNRALREGRDAPSGSKGTRKRKWYLMDTMEFLKDFVGVHRKMGSNTDDGSQVEEQQEADNSMKDIPNAAVEDAPTSQPMVEDFTTPQPRQKKSSAAEKVADPMIAFLKSRTKGVDEKENPTLTFFKSLFPDVDTLSAARKRKFKLEMMALLNRHLEELENFAYFHQSEPFPSASSLADGTTSSESEQIIYSFQ